MKFNFFIFFVVFLVNFVEASGQQGLQQQAIASAFNQWDNINSLQNGSYADPVDPDSAVSGITVFNDLSVTIFDTSTVYIDPSVAVFVKNESGNLVAVSNMSESFAISPNVLAAFSKTCTDSLSITCEKRPCNSLQPNTPISAVSKEKKPTAVIAEVNDAQLISFRERNFPRPLPYTPLEKPQFLCNSTTFSAFSLSLKNKAKGKEPQPVFFVHNTLELFCSIINKARFNNFAAGYATFAYMLSAGTGARPPCSAYIVQLL